MFFFSLSFFLQTFIVGSSAYHQNSNRRSARYPDRDRDREKDRLDRVERDRERVHARERDMPLNYDDELNDRDRHYGGGGGIRDEFQLHRDERRAQIDRDPRNRDPRVDRVDRGDRTHIDVGSNSRHLVNNSSNYDDSVDLIREKDKERFAHRRDREADYSPHRGSNRRVLNANAM